MYEHIHVFCIDFDCTNSDFRDKQDEQDFL